MNSITFNNSKNELFKLVDNYKTLHRKLKSNYKIEMQDLFFKKFQIF